MLDQFRLLVLERDLAVRLSGVETEHEAVAVSVSAIVDFKEACGVAILVDHPDSVRVDVRAGRYGDYAYGLAAPGFPQEATLRRTALFLNDRRGTLGRMVYACQREDEWDAAFHCSFERIATMLSATLRRLITLRAVDAASRDRALLVRELRHRTRNTLQLIKSSVTFLVKTLSDATAAALEALDARICALVSVHEMLNFTGASSFVSAESYFSRLAEALKRITPDGSGDFISLYDSDEDALIPIDRAATIGLIVYELVVNSIKHAVGHSSLMRLRVSFDGGNLFIRYSDFPRSGSADRAGEAVPVYRPCGEGEEPWVRRGGSGLHLIEALIGRARGTRLREGSGAAAFAACFPLAE